MADRNSGRKSKGNENMRTKKPKRQYDIIETNWCNFPGNKRSLMEEVLDFIPSETDTFLDLFGGTGIVTANAYHNQDASEGLRDPSAQVPLADPSFPSLRVTSPRRLRGRARSLASVIRALGDLTATRKSQRCVRAAERRPACFRMR